MITQVIASLVVAFGSCYVLSRAIRSYAVKREWFDVPNRRSSHNVATPRGGGLAIVATFLASISWVVWAGQLALNEFVALAGGGVVVAGVGLWDDRRNVPPLWRSMFHVAAVAWAIWWLGGIGPLNVGVGIWEWGYLGYFVVTIGLVWLINLTNFMDGIDAMASTEIAFAGAFAGGLLMLGGSAGLGWACWVLAASTLGCLRWNWPPAKIFLGDVGSGFLGFVYGVLMLAATNKEVSSFWPWLILFGVFVVDATVTLTRRVVAGMRWYEAHRSHAYQHAASRWGHLRVTVAVCVINVVWLAPMTFVAWMWPGTAPLVFIFSLSPLVALAVHLNAGKAAGSAM